jgi:hypothetical protein
MFALVGGGSNKIKVLKSDMKTQQMIEATVGSQAGYGPFQSVITCAKFHPGNNNYVFVGNRVRCFIFINYSLVTF